MVSRELTVQEAQAIARRFKVKLPKMGYEVSLGAKRWLRSTGHSDFGWFDKPPDTKPYELTCRCDEELRPREPRGCPKDCPNYQEA